MSNGAEKSNFQYESGNLKDKMSGENQKRHQEFMGDAYSEGKMPEKLFFLDYFQFCS